MRHQTTLQEHVERDIARARIERLLQEPTSITPVLARRVAALERQAPQIIELARRTGYDIDYQGIGPLFAQQRLYAGPESDWVVGPANGPNDIWVPAAEREAVRALRAANLPIARVYIGHEIPKERTAHLQLLDDAPIELTQPEAAALVGPVPEPAASVELANRLGRRSTQIVNAIEQAGKAVGAATLTAAASAAAIAGDAVDKLDPIVLGAIPALRDRPGEPAAWYVLARWDW